MSNHGEGLGRGQARRVRRAGLPGRAKRPSRLRRTAQPGRLGWAQIIGAATAIITIIAAIIYGLGAASLGLRLWYIKDPVTVALGQIPHSFLLIPAFIYVMLPSIFAGVLAYFLYRWLAKERWHTSLIEGNKIRAFQVIALALLVALIPWGFLWLFNTKTYNGVIRPFWEIYIPCAVLSVLAIYLALNILLPIKSYERASALSHSQYHEVLRIGTRVGVAALALIPCVSFSAAAVPLPEVVLCGTIFNHEDVSDRHYAIGNLIGTSGQWVYVAETRTRKGARNQHIYVGSYIAVIPLSAVRLEGIGKRPECNDLVPSTASGTSPGRAVETDPVLAIDYAEKSVGSCINKAFRKNHNPRLFPAFYVGGGMVRFEAERRNNPVGNPASWTLIDVQTYANGYVADNSELDHWGCQPSNGGLIPGYYVNGKPGTAHWFILLMTEPGGGISGTIAFVSHGDQASLPQTFTGRAQLGLATMRLSHAGLRTAQYRSGRIILGSCTAWLKHILESRECAFMHSGGIN